MKNYWSALILGIGIALSGYFIYCGIDTFAKKDRYVTVKGLSEREVLANKVVWTIRYAEVGDNLQTIYASMNEKQSIVLQFLKEAGVSDADIMVRPISVNDRKTSAWNMDDVKTRYQGFGTILVTSVDVDKVRAVVEQQTELLKRGVVVEADGYRVNYEYTGLTDLKPLMIEEATKNARAVAQKFANDAQCDLGSIKYANQGQFSITADDNLPHIMKVRVVTTIEYYLK